MRTTQKTSVPAIRRIALASLCCSLLWATCAQVSAADEKQIASVVQRGGFAYGDDANGTQLFSLSARDGVVGFTGSTVSIRRGSFIYIYNAKGSQTGSVPAGN